MARMDAWKGALDITLRILWIDDGMKRGAKIDSLLSSRGDLKMLCDTLLARSEFICWPGRRSTNLTCRLERPSHGNGKFLLVYHVIQVSLPGNHSSSDFPVQRWSLSLPPESLTD